MSLVETLSAAHPGALGPAPAIPYGRSPSNPRALFVETPASRLAAVEAAEAALANIAAVNAAAAQAAAINAANVEAALADKALASATAATFPATVANGAFFDKAAVAKGVVAHGAIDVSAIQDISLERWLDTHNNNLEGVFLSVIQDKTGYAISWAYGPFVLDIKMSFTGVTGEFGINVPLRGYKKLLDIDGDLITGISAGFAIGVANGHINLYLKRRQVVVELKASAFGSPWEITHVLLALLTWIPTYFNTSL
ncbi:hypothetical protein BOTBODRAFT_144173 [Botryobasidium botryosum FD-172 SS1]|uniref:Uncharacterized protein n=1 Tax=Botryobasidium botryosum (strain FD-172 SS1) TaxID=930990 RepID=A0A067N0G9_BOTB1|nr:hypothetical protein BOTBODRAFT_144173 [Botryobasidium botryosum FD-172 SS1]